MFAEEWWLYRAVPEEKGLEMTGIVEEGLCRTAAGEEEPCNTAAGGRFGKSVGKYWDVYFVTVSVVHCQLYTTRLHLGSS